MRSNGTGEGYLEANLGFSGGRVEGGHRWSTRELLIDPGSSAADFG